MVDYGEAIKRPFSDFKKLSIGALMYLIPVVSIITSLFASGYILECARTGMKKRFALPEWKDWGKLIIDGLLMLVIGIVYSIPMLIVCAVTVGSIMFSAMTAIMSGNFSSLLGLFAGAGIGMLITVIVAVLTLYIVPSAVVNFAQKGNFGAAFDFNTVFRKAFNGKYFTAWILGVLFNIVVMLVAFGLSMLLVITFVLPLIINAYAAIITGIVFMTIIGQVYAEIK